MVTDVEVEKDTQSSKPEEEIQVQTTAECSQSDVDKAENEELSNVEATGVEDGEKEELSHVDNKSLIDSHTQPEEKAEDCLEQPVATDIATNGDDFNSDSNANYSSIAKDDPSGLDIQSQVDSVASSEVSPETKRKDEPVEDMTNGGARMESSNGVMVGQSHVANGTIEEELNNEEERADATLDDETKKKISSEGVSGMDMFSETGRREEDLTPGVTGMDLVIDNELKEDLPKSELDIGQEAYLKTLKNSFLLGPDSGLGDETGTEEEQAAFMKELETFHKERCLEFKAPKFYGEPLNCLKLWRAVIKLGGYEQVTSCKLWRQVGESFKPPKTCTTVSWTFRCFYEKALLEYEKYKMRNGELPFADSSLSEPSSAGNQAGLNQTSGSGRARRDAAARAMQGWHSQRLLGNGEVGVPIIKDKNSISTPKRENKVKSIGLLKRKMPSPVEHAVKVVRMKASKSQLDTMVVDVGSPADWVKINVQRTKDCFEVYALVPGLLREEVRVQSDPAGRLVISGQPEHMDNPWGVTPFKKVVSLPSRIDPHQTSAVVTLHGQLFVRVPFEQSEM